jgi:DNA-binding MurR/RpiR family transcriptional regulator
MFDRAGDIYFMIKIDLSNLNALEQRIYDKLLESSKEFDDITITQAAEMCGCSISKISKFSKKLGFKNYKQYVDFLYGKELSKEEASSEFDRLKKFMDDFDFTLIDDFLDLLDQYDKICLFGYGPSFIVAQYFEYKLRFSTNKYTIALPDELSVINMLDDKSLLVIFTTTGAWRSFENIYNISRKKGGKVLVIAEEYNSSLMGTCDRLFWLSKFHQPGDLDAHEKSRTVFFIFIEEVINRLLQNRKHKPETTEKETE